MSAQNCHSCLSIAILAEWHWRQYPLVIFCNCTANERDYHEILERNASVKQRLLSINECWYCTKVSSYKLTGKCPILSDWAVTPWERILEGLEEVENAPTDDHIIVETHKAAHLQTDRWRYATETAR